MSLIQRMSAEQVRTPKSAPINTGSFYAQKKVFLRAENIFAMHRKSCFYA